MSKGLRTEVRRGNPDEGVRGVVPVKARPRVTERALLRALLYLILALGVVSFFHGEMFRPGGEALLVALSVSAAGLACSARPD